MTIAGGRLAGGRLGGGQASAGRIAGLESSGGPVPTVTVTMPPASLESSEESIRDRGQVGADLTGHYWLLGVTHYVWYRHGGFGWDPGDFDTALAGLTGIEVTLAGSNRTAAQVATATATAIDDEGTYGATADGADVVVTGTDTASAGPRTVETAGECGIRGMQTWDLAGLNNFGNGATSGALLDAADLPADPVVITGMRVTVGNVHTAQLTVAIYQGGGSDTDFNGATLVGVVGTTSGSATLANLYVECPEPFVVDFTAGRTWVLWSHDAGGYAAPYPFSSSADPVHVAARDTSNWVVASNNVTREINTVPLSSDPEDWPASLGAVTGQTVGMPPIAIGFVTRDEFQCDMRIAGRIGTRAAAAALIGTSANTLIVGNSFITPDKLGMTVLDGEVAYNVHDPASHYRISMAVGGAAADDFSGATFYDVGLADTAGAGWVAVTPTAGTISIPADERIFITVHHTAGASSLRFDAGTPDAYGPPSNPAAYFNGNTTESEYDDGTLGGAATTNVSFDENDAQSGVIVPDGDLYNNDNSPGVRLRFEVPGFAVSA